MLFVSNANTRTGNWILFFFSPWKLLKAVLNSRFRANKLPHQVYCHVLSNGWNATESNDFHLCLNERTVFGRLKASLKRKKERIKKADAGQVKVNSTCGPSGAWWWPTPKDMHTPKKKKDLFFFPDNMKRKKEWLEEINKRCSLIRNTSLWPWQWNRWLSE